MMCAESRTLGPDSGYKYSIQFSGPQAGLESEDGNRVSLCLVEMHTSKITYNSSFWRRHPDGIGAGAPLFKQAF